MGNDVVASEEPLFNFVADDLSFVDKTIAELLSASEDLCTQLDMLISSTPVHPFERLKHEYLEPGCDALCLSSITLDENFCLSSISAEISSIAVKYSDLFDLQVRALTTDKMEEVYTAFAMPSGEHFVIDKSKVAGHLQYIQMVNSIPISLVDEDPVIVAQKLLTQYVRTY